MSDSVLDPLRARANRFWYLWKRSNWLVDPRAALAHFRRVEIDRPIFLVGNQGDGLTLISRMLRRHPQVVSLSGNHRYWSGADEMHRAFLGRLPASLVSGGRWLGKPPHHDIFTPPRSWSYGSNELIDKYRLTETDFDQRTANRLQRVLRESLFRHGKPTGGRFLDKSQTYTVKISYINALLRDANPHFVLVTRNPYASIYRNATGSAGDMRRYSSTLDLDTRFELCLQHWLNSMRCVEEDKGKVSFTTLRFEDVLVEPERCLRTLCDFLDLPFVNTLVPAPGDTLPFGSRFSDRWYPLRPNVNDRYLSQLPERFERQITERAGKLAAAYGYHPSSGKLRPTS
ncbi:MAG: sulfotransferase [Acidobacteriota bacterium]|nr:sulfotransferase [Acidobacteriota bacterium]